MPGLLRHPRRRDERGAVALISAVLAVILLVIAAFVVDIGSTWERRGRLQIQADHAALYAADALPGFDAGSRLRVAKSVAFYVACHPVPGQHELNADLPDCPAGTTEDSAPIETYAQTMLSNGWVTFPTRTQVKVVTPPANVEFAFGPVIGAKRSVQQKTATAATYSPGDILPMGLSLSCLASFLGSAPGGIGNATSDVVPLNYVSAGTETGSGAGGGSGTNLTWPTYSGGTSSSITISSVDAGGLGVIVSGSGWGTVAVSPTVQVIFRKAGKEPAPVAGVHVAGQTTVALPNLVASSPGDWQVRVAVRNASGDWVMSDTSFTYTVPTAKSKLTDILDIDNFVSCGRLADSPRSDTQQINWLSANIRNGLDHKIVQHDGLATVAQNLNLQDFETDTATELNSILNNPSILFSCDPNDTANVIDIPSEIAKGLYPNCLRVNTSANRVSQLTEGFLNSGGRFDCATNECFDTPISLPGYSGQYNDDHFDTFVIDSRQNLLTDQMFFGLSSYLTKGLPLITPQSAISQDIYRSPRFFWVAVVSTAYTTQGGEDYPILTFRPVFISQGRPNKTPVSRAVDEYTLDIVQKIQAQAGNLVATMLSFFGVTDLTELALQDDGLRNLLAWLGNDVPTYEEHGMIFEKKDGLLHALRFLTIEPDALPVVPSDFGGPVTDYVGVGPKIIRLVR